MSIRGTYLDRIRYRRPRPLIHPHLIEGHGRREDQMSEINRSEVGGKLPSLWCLKSREDAEPARRRPEWISVIIGTMACERRMRYRFSWHQLWSDIHPPPPTAHSCYHWPRWFSTPKRKHHISQWFDNVDAGRKVYTPLLSTDPGSYSKPYAA